MSSSVAAWGQDNLHSPGPLLMGWAGRWSKSRPGAAPPSPPPTRAKQQGLCAGRKGGRHTARHEACLFSPGIHPLLPHALRSYHPLRITSHTPPEQNPRCSRQTSFTNAPNPSAPSSLGGTAQLPKRLQVSQGTVLVIWKPFNTHTGGEPLLAASDGPAVPSASPASARARLPLFTTAHQI